MYRKGKALSGDDLFGQINFYKDNFADEWNIFCTTTTANES